MGRIMLGVALCFFGSCSALGALVDSDSNGRLGGAVIALILFVFGIPLIIHGAKSRRFRDIEPVANLIECPHCAERIQPKAKLCRFCGRDVAQVVRDAPSANA